MTSTPNEGTGVNSVSTNIWSGSASGFTVTLPEGAAANVTYSIGPINQPGLTFGSWGTTVLDANGIGQSVTGSGTLASPWKFFNTSPNGSTYTVNISTGVTLNPQGAPSLFAAFLNPTVSPTDSGQTNYTIIDQTLALLVNNNNVTQMTVQVAINGGGGAPPGN